MLHNAKALNSSDICTPDIVNSSSLFELFWAVSTSIVSCQSLGCDVCHVHSHVHLQHQLPRASGHHSSYAFLPLWKALLSSSLAVGLPLGFVLSLSLAVVVPLGANATFHGFCVL